MTLKEIQNKRNITIGAVVLIVIAGSIFAGLFIPRLLVEPFLNAITKDLKIVVSEEVKYFDNEAMPVHLYKLKSFSIEPSVIDFIITVMCIMSFITGIFVATVMIFYKSNTIESDLSARDRIGKESILQAIREDVEQSVDENDKMQMNSVEKAVYIDMMDKYKEKENKKK